MNWLKKNFFKILNFASLVFVLIYTPLVAFKGARDYEIYTKPAIESKIYTLWHVETFEGGSKARVNYLKSIARALEKKHDGVLFYIKSINPENLASEIKLNTPDIISFGYGVGEIVLDKVIPFDKTYGVRDNLIESGTFNGKLYAIPYIASGYALITHGVLTDNIHAGSGYNDVSPITQANGYKLAEIESGYEAYKDFVYDKTTTLIGTGRDVYRVDNLNNTGRTNASITPFDTYTDLIQYLSIFSHDDIIEEFVYTALSDEYQSTLDTYKLYPVGYNKIYTTGIYSDMENAIYHAYSPRVFR